MRNYGHVHAAIDCVNHTGEVQDVSTPLMVLGAILGMWGGKVIGDQKAFLLRVQAQTALCQMQIERNSSVIAQMQIEWNKRNLDPPV